MISTLDYPGELEIDIRNLESAVYFLEVEHGLKRNVNIFVIL